MARGRQPQGSQPLSGAERQARYRARHAHAPVIRYRKSADRRSRCQRWQDAVAERLALQAEYGRWFEALPEPFRDTATGEAPQAILDLNEIWAIEPPRIAQPDSWRSLRNARVPPMDSGDDPHSRQPNRQPGGPDLNVGKGPVPNVA